jgi:hypothetical protein
MGSRSATGSEEAVVGTGGELWQDVLVTMARSSQRRWWAREREAEQERAPEEVVLELEGDVRLGG